MKTDIHFVPHLAHFVFEWEMFQTDLYRKSQHQCHVQQFFFSENRTVYEIIRKNIVEPGRPQMTIWRMRIACWIPKTTNTPSEYVIIIAFPLQQKLQEYTSVLRITYIARLVYVSWTAKRGSCTHPSAAGAIFRCLVGSDCTEDCRLQAREKKRMLNSKYQMNVTKFLNYIQTLKLYASQWHSGRISIRKLLHIQDTTRIIRHACQSLTLWKQK